MVPTPTSRKRACRETRKEQQVIKYQIGMRTPTTRVSAFMLLMSTLADSSSNCVVDYMIDCNTHTQSKACLLRDTGDAYVGKLKCKNTYIGNLVPTCNEWIPLGSIRYTRYDVYFNSSASAETSTVLTLVPLEDRFAYGMLIGLLALIGLPQGLIGLICCGMGSTEIENDEGQSKRVQLRMRTCGGCSIVVFVCTLIAIIVIAIVGATDP